MPFCGRAALDPVEPPHGSNAPRRRVDYLIPRQMLFRMIKFVNETMVVESVINGTEEATDRGVAKADDCGDRSSLL